ncbi:TenA family protein [Kineosporia sp. NBRC 101731]|uniref:TenA family protein n=1 Tax=Kineosporia sp. NBRC 101731 TaxID=3032199 RepID=UPI0024A20370|nr:TenA family protein [Kineosporia sp. NBRC 101731]GLY30975.1 TenA family transcriptional regulator [Kineosporia sp. NBRC 101731]
MSTLSQDLREYGRPRVERWAEELPLLAGVARGDLPIGRFRHYLEQDYVYLREYARLYARLAANAPDEHVEHLVRLAANLIDVELDSHRALGAAFGADLTDVRPSSECRAYIAFLRESTTTFGEGLVASLPCLWGYGVALARVPMENSGPYRAWLEVYTSGDYTAMIERHCRMIDESGLDADRARELFDRAMEHEIAFWNQEVA